MENSIKALSPQEALTVLALMEASALLYNRFQRMPRDSPEQMTIERCDKALEGFGFSPWVASPVVAIWLEKRANGEDW